MEEEKRVEGPPMICATKVLRPGGHRIGQVAGFKFPRTVSLVTAVLCLIFGILGAGLGVLASGQPSGFGVGLAIGGMIGYVLSTTSPLKGESMFTWILLQIKTAGKKQRIDGKPVTMAAGTHVAPRVAEGSIFLRRSAVRVNPALYDNRGVLLVKKSK